MCMHADERGLVRGKALCALDDLKQQRPAVFLPINYFIFTFIFPLVGVSVFHRLTESRVINRKKNSEQKNKKLPPFLFLHVLINVGFCDIGF